MNIVPQAKKSRKQYCSSGQDVRLNSDIEDQQTEKKINYIDLFLLRKQFWKCFLKKLSRQYCLFYHSLYHGIIHFLHINCMSRPICSQSQCGFFCFKIFLYEVWTNDSRDRLSVCAVIGSPELFILGTLLWIWTWVELGTFQVWPLCSEHSAFSPVVSRQNFLRDD